MRPSLPIFVCVALAIVCSGCSSVPSLTEYANEPTTLDQALTYSPVVLVGTIAGPEHYIGPYRQSRWVSPPAESRVQLVRVAVNVETVLRSDGEIPKGHVDIYYFVWSFIGHRRLGNWKVGDRVMFLLRRENGYLRTIGDQSFNSTAIQVFSGRHPGFRSGSFPDSVINLLLTRGERVGDEQMIRAIQESARVTEIHRDYAIRKLQPLIEHETPAVAAAACKELRALVESCSQIGCTSGFWQIPCNDNAKLNLPCPGQCCGVERGTQTPPVQSR
jgi:hypothetical protein